MLWLLDALELAKKTLSMQLQRFERSLAMANYIMRLLARELRDTFEMKRTRSAGQHRTVHACICAAQQLVRRLNSISPYVNPRKDPM